MSKSSEKMKQNIQLERELAELAGQAGILSFESAPQTIRDVIDNTADLIQHATTQPLFDKVYSSIPNPPKEIVEESEFLTLIRNNFSNPQSAVSDFPNYVFIEMKNKNFQNRIMRIDAKRYFQFSLVENGNDIEIFLVDEKTNSKRELSFDELPKELYKLFDELHAFSEWKNYEDYKYVLYDTSYQREDGITETAAQKQERLEKIDNQYLELKQSGYFTEEQLKILYKIMHMDYDINCFACPLFSDREMYLLASMFSISIAKDPSERPKLENFLRTFNEFCSNNFKHQFSFSEFGRLFTAANEGRIMEEINDPDFDLLFKLDYLIDSARDTLGGTIKYNINDKTFLITAKDQRDLDGNFLETYWKIELEDPVSLKPQLLFDSRLHELKLHTGPITIFTDAYYQKHKTQNDIEYINICMNEVKKAAKSDSEENREMIIELNNGSRLKIRGISFTPGSEKMVYGDPVEYGCEIYLYKPNQQPKLVYSDNREVTFQRAEKLSSIINANGGIHSKDTFLKNQSEKEIIPPALSIADEILKDKPTPVNTDNVEINQDIASEILGKPDSSKYQIDVAQEVALMYKKTLKDFEETEDTKLKNVIKLSNGNEIIFTPKKYLDARELTGGKHIPQTKYGVKVEIKDNEGKMTTFFDITTITQNGMFVPQIRGDLTKVAYYYRQAERIHLKPDYAPLNQITDFITKDNKQKTNDETIR